MAGFWPDRALAQQQTTADTHLLSKEQLDQLVAPVALYPDSLLAQVLVASTYPLEIIEAARWADANKGLKGDQLAQALQDQTWDNSVKALVSAPTALSMMSQKLDWTQKLGDAVLAQQPDVMDAVQRLRQRAQATGKLKTTQEQTVTVKTEDAQPTVVIEPVSPEIVYVPYYDPALIFAPWPYPAYPPFFFAPPLGYIAGPGLWFGAGFYFGGWAAWDHFDWHHGNIYVNNHVNIYHDNFDHNDLSKWQFNPEHRQGVRYDDPAVAAKYGAANVDDRNLDDFRGRSGDDVLHTDGGQDLGAHDRSESLDGDKGEDHSAGAFDRSDDGWAVGCAGRICRVSVSRSSGPPLPPTRVYRQETSRRGADI